jgi:hypothetical protein
MTRSLVTPPRTPAALLFASAGLSLTLAALPARGEDYSSPTEERVQLTLGFLHVSSATHVRLDSDTGAPGTMVDGEDTFGLDKSDFEPKFQAMVRVGERSRLRFDYFSLDRTGDVTLTSPIQFRDVQLLTGDPLQTTLSLRTLGITYEYSFLHRERFELAATLSVNETDISAQGKVSTQTRHLDQTEDAAGPIPTVGLDSTWVVSKRFYLDGRGQYLKVNIDSIHASLGLYELDALYRLRPNIAFGVGYSIIKADLLSRKPTESGVFDFDTKGPEAFVRIAF